MPAREGGEVRRGMGAGMEFLPGSCLRRPLGSEFSHHAFEEAGAWSDRRFGASKHTPPASYNWWNTKKIWVLGSAGKSSKLLLIIGALGTEGRAAPPDLGKILIRFARNMS